jgi:PGF-pre-PGF domain-containing protein
MNYKKVLLFAFSALVLIGFLSGVSAALSVKIYLSNESNISGSAYPLNATLTSEAVANVGNVTFYYQPVSYAHNETWALIGRSSNNVTPNQTWFNITWDTTAITAWNYTLNVTSWNYNPSGGDINATNSSSGYLGVTVDNTPPTVAVYGTSPTAYANGTSIKTAATFANNLTLSVYVNDTRIGMTNASVNAHCFINVNGGLNHSVPMIKFSRWSGWCNSSNINITDLTDGNKTINIYVNDTLTNLLNNTLVVQIDTTSPTATATCSPTTINAGDTFPCTCSGTDATSGLNTNTGTSTSGSVTSTSSTGAFTYTCTTADWGGLTTSATDTYSVTQIPNTGGSTTSPSERVHSWTKITPGAATIMKDFNAETGIKEIQIEVNNEAQNVKITVTKYSGRPANVSVSKTGKVYQYLRIETQNLADKLKNATVEFKVAKSWAESNGLGKEEVAVSKFDEVGKKWNQLDTTYVSEDSAYYYYDVAMNSFSYFAISEKAVVSGGDEETGANDTSSGNETRSGEISNWWWALTAVVVIVAISYYIRKKK